MCSFCQIHLETKKFIKQLGNKRVVHKERDALKPLPWSWPIDCSNYTKLIVAKKPCDEYLYWNSMSYLILNDLIGIWIESLIYRVPERERERTNLTIFPCTWEHIKKEIEGNVSFSNYLLITIVAVINKLQLTCIARSRELLFLLTHSRRGSHR